MYLQYISLTCDFDKYDINANPEKYLLYKRTLFPFITFTYSSIISIHILPHYHLVEFEFLTTVAKNTHIAEGGINNTNATKITK